MPSLIKRIIFNADDFGLDSNTNEAVVRTHRDGVLTSASLMVSERGAAEAVELARRNLTLDVGLHLTLSDGRPTLQMNEIPSLITSEGKFQTNPAIVGLKTFFIPEVRRQMQKEVAAQFRAYDETGLPLTHVNGHQHLHIHPVIWKALLPRVRESSCKWIRVPDEEWWPHTTQNWGLRRCEWAFFRAISRSRKRSLSQHGLRSTDRVYGHIETGNVSETYLLRLIPKITASVAEIYLHPGTPHAAGAPGGNQDVEVEALAAHTVRTELARSGAIPTRFSEIV